MCEECAAVFFPGVRVSACAEDAQQQLLPECTRERLCGGRAAVIVLSVRVSACVKDVQQFLVDCNTARRHRVDISEQVVHLSTMGLDSKDSSIIVPQGGNTFTQAAQGCTPADCEQSGGEF